MTLWDGGREDGRGLLGLDRPLGVSSPPMDESEARIAELVAGCRARRPAFDVPEEVARGALRASVAPDPDPLGEHGTGVEAGRDVEIRDRRAFGPDQGVDSSAFHLP